MLIVKRLTRPEQNERNRALVLDAARRIFLARGYHGATVEEIADDAGFSRGVVYSQFGTKPDLLLALLEARMAERAAQATALAAGLSGERGAVTLMEGAAGRDRDDPGWGLLLIEFRAHAARDAPTCSRLRASTAGRFPPAHPPGKAAERVPASVAAARRRPDSIAPA